MRSSAAARDDLDLTALFHRQLQEFEPRVAPRSVANDSHGAEKVGRMQIDLDHISQHQFALSKRSHAAFADSRLMPPVLRTPLGINECNLIGTL